MSIRLLIKLDKNSSENNLSRKDLTRIFDYAAREILNDVKKENINICGERLKQLVDIRVRKVQRLRS